jgi:hypothetical protein
VEVGRRIQKTFTVKNEGLYDVKFNFNKGKKVYKDCFEITPNSGEIKPNETKEISVRLKS